jgi:type I restriction enzyme S subunit
MRFSLRPLGDFFTFSKGLGYLGKYLESSDVALVGLNSFEGGGGYKKGGEKEYSGPFRPEHVARPGELYISTTDITQDGRVLASPFLMPDLSEKYREVIFSGDIVRADSIRDGLYPEFVYNVLRVKAFRQKAAYASTGSTVRRIPAEVLQRLEIPVPTQQTQEAINRLVRILDSKIEVNTSISVATEEMAQSIFKSWFIDFDPVHAKARGEKPAGMDAETAALFPDSFEQSELGLVPSGWSVLPLVEISEYRNGLALQKYPSLDGDESLPVIKIPQLKANSADGAGRASIDVPEKFVVDDGDILFSWSGALEVCFWAGGKGALNQHLFKVVPLKTESWFAYFSTLKHLPWFREIAQSKATTMGHIQRTHLAEAKVVLPSSEALQAGTHVFAPLVNLHIDLRVQNRKLRSLRDSLLPRLISGDLEVSEELLVD